MHSIEKMLFYYEESGKTNATSAQISGITFEQQEDCTPNKSHQAEHTRMLVCTSLRSGGSHKPKSSDLLNKQVGYFQDKQEKNQTNHKFEKNRDNLSINLGKNTLSLPLNTERLSCLLHVGSPTFKLC